MADCCGVCRRENTSKKSTSYRWLNPFATSLAFAFKISPLLASVFHLKTHLALTTLLPSGTDPHIVKVPAASNPSNFTFVAPSQMAACLEARASATVVGSCSASRTGLVGISVGFFNVLCSAISACKIWSPLTGPSVAIFSVACC